MVQRRPIHVLAKPAGAICNLGCEYCFYLDKEQLYPRGSAFRMTEAVLRRYIQQYIAASPGPTVAFSWQGGEPTLMGLDFFRQVVALQKELVPPGWRCTNSLQTNGTLLDDAWCRFLREEGFLVGISLDGPASLHDHFRVDKGGKPTHDRVMHGLRLLQQHGVEYNVLAVVNAVNVRHPLEVYRFFREQGVTWIQFIPLVEPLQGGGVSDRSVSGAAYGEFLVAIFEEWVRHDVGRVFIQVFEECLSVWAGRGAGVCIYQETCGGALALEHNGDLYACDHFVDPEHLLGNITLAPLADLAASPRQSAFGAQKQSSLPAQCLSCDVRFICNGGCPKDRIGTSRDGEPGLNHLCEGYYRFFKHVDPYMRRMVELLHSGLPAAALSAQLRAEGERRWARVGRNDPCPCGSGKKYKACCLSRGRHCAPFGNRSEGS